MQSFSINDIPEFSKKDCIVVVGVIGKSAYRYPNKTTPLLPSADCEEKGIQCYWDERTSILYLHATTSLDTKQLTALAANLDKETKSTEKDADGSDWLVVAGELAAESCRDMALIFHLCHIVVLSSPTHLFDLGYLQLFKAIDAYRTELAPQTTDALTPLGLGGAWESHGRSCCPRLLLHCRRAPGPLRGRPAALKRLEHALEDQLYFILRKARIITNVCAKSLFAIPKNEEFVYVDADPGADSARDVSGLVRGLVGLCAGAPGLGAPGLGAPGLGTPGVGAPGLERPSFKQFLNAHVELAFGDGFDDNVGKYAMSTSFFELPSASSWRAAAAALAPVYLRAGEGGAGPAAGGEGGGALHDALATDVRFSQARCAKVLPIAQASYTEGLPAHYSSQHHAHKLSVALGVLATMARGPLSAAARARLTAACEAAWRARRLCEARSLTNHPCQEPEHDHSIEHSSGVRYIAACNCGRTKSSREDPYSVRRANYTFYAAAAEACGVCDTLPEISFPVFQPSTLTYRAASVKSGQSSQEGEPEREEGGTQGSAPEGAWSGSPEALSPGSQAEEDASPRPQHSPDGLDVVSLREDCGTTGAGIVRQPSTTEYLPGMLHAGSPAGLLPAYPAWSLRCLGASSLYSHALGLPEHLQPGFLPHTNFLLPWDCAVSRMEQVSAWRAAQAAARGRGAKPSAPHHLTVKIFIGIEYECPRGHRFMMSGPDAVVAGGGAGAGAGARLAASPMPLYAACPCRAGKPLTAHVARVHVVTPKAPLHVTLQPRVQPVAGGPIFVPQPAGEPPVKLSASAYWVLRLPYMYSAERGPLPRPPAPAPAPLAAGTLLAPLFGLAD